MTRRILVVEDDDATRAGLVELLTRAGYEVSGVATVSSALTILHGVRPDLLISDVRVQGENGLQLAALFGRLLPVIVLTGFNDPGLEAEARAMGAEYLIKPLSPPTLLETVSQALAKGPAPFSHDRRWSRKHPRYDVAAQADLLPARIVDLSYGGVCVSVQRAASTWPASSLLLVVPGWEQPFHVRLVWKHRTHQGRWLCGGAITSDDSSRWQRIVDTLPA